MKTGFLVSTGMALMVACSLQSASHGQFYHNNPTPALQYFGGRQAASGQQGPLTQVGGRAITQGHQQLQVSGGKPFEHVQRQSTLSPYLALDAVPESNTSLPNWHLFVQPQMQQRNAGEAHARQLMRARQQMRVASARHILPESAPVGVPITGSSTQFLNMGSYFPGAR